MSQFVVKIRKVADGRANRFTWFLSGSGMNRLLVHATRFDDAAAATVVAHKINSDNPDYHAVVRPAK